MPQRIRIILVNHFFPNLENKESMFEVLIVLDFSRERLSAPKNTFPKPKSGMNARVVPFVRMKVSEKRRANKAEKGLSTIINKFLQFNRIKK